MHLCYPLGGFTPYDAASRRHGEQSGSTPTPHVQEPTLGNFAAIALALVAAAFFALAALFQHDAVASAGTAQHPDKKLLGRAAFRALTRNRRWWIGMALVIVASLLHVVALALAPVTIVQPVGVLAVPMSIALDARFRGRLSTRRAHQASWLTVLGVAAFVVVAATSIDAPKGVPGEARAALILTVGGIISALTLLAFLSRGRRRCLLAAAAGAVCFGLTSALVRMVSLLLDNGVPLTEAMTPVAILLIAYVVGGWITQQAYASGPPEIVVAILTVLDPVTAIIGGMTALGEGTRVGWGTGLSLLCAAGIAGWGAVQLARHATPTATCPPCTVAANSLTGQSNPATTTAAPPPASDNTPGPDASHAPHRGVPRLPSPELHGAPAPHPTKEDS